MAGFSSGDVDSRLRETRALVSECPPHSSLHVRRGPFPEPHASRGLGVLALPAAPGPGAFLLLKVAGPSRREPEKLYVCVGGDCR